MAISLFLLASLAFIAGCGFFGIAKSAIHEIEGLLCFLISAVLLTGSAIVSACRRAAYLPSIEEVPLSDSLQDIRREIRDNTPRWRG